MMEKTLRILHVDDNPDDRALALREIRRELGCVQIEEIRDSEGFERALESGDFDLVITDYRLYWTDGLSVLRAVKERFEDRPVIMLTGTGSEEIAVEAMTSGLDDYVLKSPKHLGRLPASVRMALQRARERRERAEAEARYRSLFEDVPVGLFLIATDGRVLHGNPALARILGCPDAGSTHSINLANLYVGAELRNPLQAILDNPGEPGVSERQIRRPDGLIIWVRTTLRHVRDVHGEVIYYEGTLEEITQRKRAEEALEKLAAFTRSSPNPVLELDRDGKLTYHNAAARPILEALEATQAKATLRAEISAIVTECLDTGLSNIGLETHVGDSTYTWSFVPIPAGQVVHAYAFDISRHLELESQLRQSQKMEAIGRLAGGIAHDLNNLLTVINGSCEFLMEKVASAPSLREEAEEIREAGERAAALTRQLLAFSRRQVLLPKVLDLNDLVADVFRMLRRLLPASIELSVRPEPGLGRVRVDPGQMSQVIMNLALNARDAMPEGGTLVIETSNVDLGQDYAPRHIGIKPGRYVTLSVSDTGEGMDIETRAHLFEPFFTSKERGQGTGLGLAMVHGIIKQSGGDIWVDTEPGKGTSFEIYLPRVEEDAEAARAEWQIQRAGGAAETILLVEDEEPVRAILRRILHSIGYTVLEASHGEEALQVAARHEGAIHLLMTDMVMPRMSGRDLVERISALRPEMKVLYMSAYPEDQLGARAAPEPGRPLMQKPFTRGALARKVREVLDESPAKSGDGAGVPSGE